MASQNFHRTRAETFKACKRALEELDWVVTSFDKQTGLIEAERGGNLLAFGHIVVVEVRTLKNAAVKVLVKSTALGPQIVDWGTNAKNENEIFDTLSEILA